MYPNMSKHIQAYQNVYEHIGMYPAGTQKSVAGQSKLVNVKTLRKILMDHLDIFFRNGFNLLYQKKLTSRLGFNP